MLCTSYRHLVWPISITCSICKYPSLVLNVHVHGVCARSRTHLEFFTLIKAYRCRSSSDVGWSSTMIVSPDTQSSRKKLGKQKRARQNEKPNCGMLCIYQPPQTTEAACQSYFYQDFALYCIKPLHEVWCQKWNDIKRSNWNCVSHKTMYIRDSTLPFPQYLRAEVLTK